MRRRGRSLARRSFAGDGGAAAAVAAARENRRNWMDFKEFLEEQGIDVTWESENLAFQVVADSGDREGEPYEIKGVSFEYVNNRVVIELL
jgi:hypothetical protein